MTLRQLIDKNRPASTAEPITPQQDENFWNNLGAGGYSALNSVLMGLPDFLVKNIGGEGGSKWLKDLREQHKTASDIGDIAGTVGSFLIPGGALVKGVGLGAKAVGATKAADKLGKAADYLKGGELTGNIGQKILQGAKRGAAQSLEQAVPRAIFNLDVNDPNSAQESLASLPASIGLGALTGGVLSPALQRVLGKTNLNSKVPGAAEYGEDLLTHNVGELRQMLDKATLKQAGLDTASLRNAARPLGFTTRNVQKGGRGAEDYASELASGLRKYGIRGERQFKALLEKNDKAWQDIDDAFSKKVIDTDPQWSSKLASSLSRDTDLIERVNETGSPEVAQYMGQLLSSMGSQGKLSTIRNTLSHQARALNGPTASPVEKMQGQLALLLKNKVDDYIADASGVGEAAIKEAKADYKLLQPFMASEARDAFNLGKISEGPGTAEKLIGVGALTGGGLLGSNIKDEEGNFNPLAIAAGLGAGALAKKGLTKGFNRVLDEAGRLGGDALNSPKLLNAFEGISQKGQEIAGELPKAAGIVASNIVLDQEQPGQTIDAPQDQAPPELSDRFKSVINSRLNYLYQTEYSDMAPEDFMSRVAKTTNNFSDPEANARILYEDPKDRERFLREYQAYEALKDVDLDRAIRGGGGIEIGSLGTMGGNADDQALQDQLIESLITLQTEGDVSKRTPAQMRILREYLAKAKDNPAILEGLIQSYGLDFKGLRDLGVI